ncbi:MAG: DUF1993 family protein [Caulobacter sp.]|nr:DUF1993 family protein [Caulobacter sp.]
MSLSLYDASVPVYLNTLRNLAAILAKAESHAAAEGADLQGYTEARLHPDMHPLTRQIQMLSDAAKGGGARLAGVEPPAMEDTETTFAQLKDRVARTIAFLETLKPEQVDGREAATIELKFPNRTMSFTGRDFLFNFSLPNFYFHVVTAYGLLRKEGVPLGKMDYLAGAQMAG